MTVTYNIILTSNSKNKRQSKSKSTRERKQKTKNKVYCLQFWHSFNADHTPFQSIWEPNSIFLINPIDVMIDTSWMQYRYGWRVMTTWSAMPHVAQSASHVVGALSLLHPHVLWLIILMYSSCYWPHGLYIVSPLTSIYSIDTILYPYALPLLLIPLTSLKPLPKCNLSSNLRS